MAENIQRSRGRGKGYKFDRGGNPTEFGPFIGEVKNNVDPTRSGRLQVYIDQFGGNNPNDDSLWRTVNYVPPFYGMVDQTGTNQGTGTFVGNPQSYGMWFTPPDIGTQVICFFVAGDPNQGYYIGCVPDSGINHMLPAIGASKNFDLQNSEQKKYLKDASQLPVTEINADNTAIEENPKYFTEKKPVHSYVAGVMLQQGLITDAQRGPITSNAQRESPSAVYGVSTPGRAVYSGGDNDESLAKKVNSNSGNVRDVKIIGRRGGHSLVMDDGNVEGQDNLIRIRTSKGHQITMSDDGNFFYIIHANGQSWVELGSEGTIDLFSTNSVNIRTQGEINLHADKAINMYSDDSINFKSKVIKINGVESLELASKTKLAIYSELNVSVVADGTLGLKSKSGSWNGGDSLALKGDTINLNGPGAMATTDKPTVMTDLELPDVVWKESTGWTVEEKKLKTIVSRAPTHEPYPYHNRGVEAKSSVTQFTGERGAEGGSSSTGLGGGLGGGLTASIPAGLTNALPPDLSASLASVGNTISGIATSVGNVVTDIATGIGNTVSSLATSAGNVIGDLTTSVGNAFSGFGSTTTGAEAMPVDLTSSITEKSLDMPVTDPVGIGNIMKQTPAIGSIAGLSSAQVTSLMASAALSAAKGPLQIPAQGVLAAAGVGKFNFTPVQLEQVGLLKPGTVAKFGSTAPNTLSLLASPTIWTGANGINSVNGLLNNPNIQNRIQQDLMQQGVVALRKSGVLNGLQSAPVVGGLINSAVQFGPGAVTNWVKGQGNAAIVNQINKVFKNSQFASVLGATVSNFIGGAGRRAVNIAGITDTVNRAPVNTAVTGVIGNKKVPVPEYKTVVYDVRKMQQDAKIKAFDQAIAEGKSEREADAIANAAANNVGADEIAKIKLT